ncbi:hypothetical protein EHS86_18650, partial [Erwinia amylovora]|uniref:hypothetical protein n=1 Tax=Erwinia amylovora TaxID=552 RepID=UPI001005B158
FPLVWRRVVGNLREAGNGVYHARQTFTAVLDLQQGEEGIDLAEQERLAEDLRLLYVALARSIFHCSVGIGPLIKGTRKKEGTSDLPRSALGYLVQPGEAAAATGLLAAVKGLD